MSSPEIPPLTIDGFAPAFVDKKTASIYLQSPKLVERMLWATRHTDDPWFVIAANQEGDPKQKTLLTTKSVERAAARFMRGDRPPKIGKLSLHGPDSFVGDAAEGVVSFAFPEGYDPDAEEEKMTAKHQERPADFEKQVAERDRLLREETAKRQKREAVENEIEKEKQRKAAELLKEEEKIVSIEIDL